ncbi:MAG: carboxymuconolactone decarboxylase family protein [Acidimicrobiia bacterium]
MHDLRDEVDDQQMVDRLAVNWRTARLDEPTRELLEFTERITAKPSSIDAADVERLRQQGFDDPGISSCVQVVAYFNYINRIAEGLGVPAEAWLADDGRPRSV